jgi:DNA-binding PadR family transcriptional regulator
MGLADISVRCIVPTVELSGTARVILGFLAARPRSGYEIKTAVDRSTRFFFSASYGQIYPELRRLAEAGLVEGEDDPQGGRPRRVFRLTAEGRATVLGWLEDPAGGLEMRDEVLLKVFFSGDLDPAHRRLLLAAMRERHERVLTALRHVEATLTEDVTDAQRAVLGYGLGLHSWVVEWCRATEARLGGDDGERGGE